MANKDLIYLTLLNKTAYIFNVDDYMRLRTDFRIIGNFMGNCPSRGWSVNAFAIPVELTKFETQLMIEKKVAVLVDKKESLTKEPSIEESEKYHRCTEQRIQDQENVLREEKIRDTKINIEKILEGKKKKMLSNGVLEKDINLKPDDVIQEIAKTIKFNRNNALLEVPTEHCHKHYGMLHDFPIDNSLRYRVFKDIWNRGKYVTSGEAFGADFIAYPGDPMMFHASHLVVIINEPIINPLDLIRKCRLSVIVNKIIVIAYESNNEIQYQTISWEGCMDKMQYKKRDKN